MFKPLKMYLLKFNYYINEYTILKMFKVKR